MLASEAVDKLQRQFGKRVEARVDEYRSIFERLTYSEIDRRWASVMTRWAKSTPPPPGYFADETPSAAGKNDRGEWPWQERARKAWDRCEQLCRGWFRDHQDIVRQAQNEGWTMDLRGHIRIKALMIAQLEFPASGDVQAPQDPLSFVNARMKQHHAEWITGEDVAMFQGRAETRRHHAPRWGVLKGNQEREAA